MKLNFYREDGAFIRTEEFAGTVLNIPRIGEELFLHGTSLTPHDRYKIINMRWIHNFYEIAYYLKVIE